MGRTGGGVLKQTSFGHQSVGARGGWRLGPSFHVCARHCPLAGDSGAPGSPSSLPSHVLLSALAWAWESGKTKPRVSSLEPQGP